MIMLMLMPRLTASDSSFWLTSVNDIMPMAVTLEKSLDVWGDPQSSHLWHLEFTHSGMDGLNLQTFMVREVNNTKELRLFMDDMLQNARRPLDSIAH